MGFGLFRHMQISLRSIAVTTVWLAAPALAQDGLTLPEALEQARKTHPLLSAGSARIEASQGLRRQAAFSPDPRLTFQTENIRFSGTPPFSFARDTDDFLYVSRTFET